MRFLSVCSGIEAASVAWNQLGWRAAAFAEIEAFPSAVLAHHYPDVPNLGDMTRFMEWPDLGPIDLLCGGTPCQSFSVAGLRAGLDDPRGNLMLTFGAIAAKHRPRWLVWENVPGVLSSNGGRDFGAFLGLLGLIGYGFAYRILDAQYAGLAQRRKRVFVVGCLGDWRRAAAVLFERHSLQGHPAPSREAGKNIAGAITASTGGSDENDAADARLIVSDISHCLNAGGMGRQDYESETLIAHSLTGEGFDASEDGTGRGTPLVPAIIAFDTYNQTAMHDLSQTLCSRGDTPGGNAHLVPVLAFDTTQITSKTNRSQPMAGDPCHPLAASAHSPAIAFDARQSDVIQYGDISGPLDTDGHTVAVHSRMQVRRLTPKEAARLQGFPDDYLDITYRGKPAADGNKYRALGNSWAVPVARWVGQRIEAVERTSVLREAA